VLINFSDYILIFSL